jgi:hypothetical protein
MKLIKQVTIASGASLSSAIDTEGYAVIGLRLPATLTGTTLTIKESASLTGTFNKYKVNGDEVSFTVAAGENIQFQPPIALDGAIKVDTGANEDAARTIDVLLRIVQ